MNGCGSHDNEIFWVPLSQPIAVAAHSAVTYTILHQSSTKSVALRVYPTNVSQSLIGPEGRLFNAGFVPLCVSVYLFVPAPKVRRYLLLLATARLRA